MAGDDVISFRSHFDKDKYKNGDGDDHVREACENFSLNLKFPLKKNARELEHCSKAEMSLLFRQRDRQKLDILPFRYCGYHQNETAANSFNRLPIEEHHRRPH